jgi:phage terminase large subunit
VIDNNYDCVVQVGGRFSGKSHNEQIRLVSNLAAKENYKLLVIENLETGMADGFHAGLYERIREFEHYQAYTPETKVAHIRNKINDNQAIFRGYETDQQKYNVKKLSGITEILVEEGEWMTFNDFISLYQQLRGGNKEDRKLTILMNPVNPECFVNEHLIESKPDKVLLYFEGTKRPKVFEKSISTTFDLDGEKITQEIKILIVLSTHYDNNFLTLEQRASIEQYRTTDPDLYLQLGEARFIRPSGTYFKEFDKAVHVIEPFMIPMHWKRYVSLDYGLDKFAALWFAVDTHNNVYVYKYIHEEDLIISEAAKRFKEVNNKDNLVCIYAPPDLWNRRQETGKSATDIFAENGVYFYKSNNKRVLGWFAVKEYMKVLDSKCEQTGKDIKTSKLQIFDNVDVLIDYIPRVLRDEKEPNDVASEPHEYTHILDALRGFCTMRQLPSTEPSKAVDPQHSFIKKENKTVENTMSTKIDNSFLNY